MADEITINPGDKVFVKQWDADFTEKENPAATDTILGKDSATGSPVKFTMESIQAAAAANVIGSMTPDGSPTGTESVGQSYRVSNDTDEDETYTDFLDRNGDPVVIPANSSGFLILNEDGWAFVKDNFDTEGLIPQSNIANTLTETDPNKVLGASQAGLLTSLSDFNPVKDKVEDVIKPSANLFPGVLESGYYTTTGSVSSSINWIRTPRIPVDPTWIGQDFTISGYGNVSTGASLVVVRDSGGANLLTILGDGALTDKTFTMPSNSATVAFTLDNELNIGADLISNPFLNTFMFNQGSSAVPYEPFGNIILMQKVKGIDPLLYTPKQLTNKENNIGGHIKSTGGVQTSANWVSTDYESVLPGDTYTSSGHISSPNAAVLAWAFYDSSKTFISGIPLSGDSKYTVTAPSNAAFRRNTIANITGAGATPSDNSAANNFTVAAGSEAIPYEPFKIDPKFDFGKLGGIPGRISIDVNQILVEKISSTEFYIYWQNGKDATKWMRTSFLRETTGSYLDNWRLDKVWICDRNEYSFNPVLYAVFAGAFENAISAQGYSTFIGTVHDFEKYLTVGMVLDTTTIDLLGSDDVGTIWIGKELRLIQHSNFTKSDGTGSVADVYKLWHFRDGKILIDLDINWTDTINVNWNSYIGMLCIRRVAPDGTQVTHSGASNTECEIFDVSTAGFTNALANNNGTSVSPSNPFRNKMLTWGDRIKSELSSIKREIYYANGDVKLTPLADASFYMQNTGGTENYNKNYIAIGSVITEPGMKWRVQNEYIITAL